MFRACIILYSNTWGMQKLMLITRSAMIIEEAKSVIFVFGIIKVKGCSANGGQSFGMGQPSRHRYLPTQQITSLLPFARGAGSLPNKRHPLRQYDRMCSPAAESLGVDAPQLSSLVDKREA